MTELSYTNTPDFMAKLFKGYTELKFSERIKKLMFFYFCCLMASGAVLWGVLCLINGYHMPAIIPFTYVIASFFNFLLCSQWKDNKLGCAIQVFISILLPFLFQYALGGIVNSGFVMLWSLLALLGSMTFQANKEIVAWVILFLALALHAFYLEQTMFIKTARSLPVLITGLNLLAVSGIIFGLAHYFVRMQEGMQKTFSLKKKELQIAQDGIENDLCMAKEFQDLLHSNILSSEAFASKLSFNQSKNHVNGNFHWQGDFLNNHVVVFVENPHTGIRGSMEAMMLWNMIENSVTRAEVRAPHNLIEFIQRDLYSKYDVPQIRESMREVKMTVLCHDALKNEMAYASIGSTLLINEGDNVKVLCGFNRVKGEVVTAPNGVKINIGRFMPYPSAKLLFVNDAILETLDIKDDLMLSSKESKLNSLFEWDFDIAKVELQKEVDKAGFDKDLFLLGLQI